MQRKIVSIIMITYGQREYIGQSINSILSQVCNFEVELIIADDKSPDDTDLVVSKIIEEHPNGNWIKYHKHKINKGMMPNFTWALKQAKGKYIALCEGDDYWTDTTKLQKQVDFLDENKDVSITCHNVERLDYSIDKINHVEYFNENIYLNEKQIISAGGKITPTLSYVFRSEYLADAPDWVFNSPVGDIPLMFYLMSKGKVYYFKNLMGVYRENLPGSWTIGKKKINWKKKLSYKINFIVFIQKYNYYSHNKHKKILKKVYAGKSSRKFFILNLLAYLKRLIF